LLNPTSPWAETIIAFDGDSIAAKGYLFLQFFGIHHILSSVLSTIVQIYKEPAMILQIDYSR